MKINIIGSTGKKSKSIEVSSAVFGCQPNNKLISQAVLSALANRRKPIAHTKTRGEVQGGGRKPWRQKGTGNARAGSSRSPLWRGGGVTFGPRNTRNFTKRLPPKMASQALKIALSQMFKKNRLIVVPKLKVEKISTKAMQEYLEKLPIEEGRILVVLAKTNINLELSMANLPYLKTVLIPGLNLIDILNADYIITDQESLKLIEEIALRRKQNANSH